MDSLPILYEARASVNEGSAKTPARVPDCRLASGRRISSFDQKRNFKPSCKVRGLLVLLICPKSALVTPELGFVNWVWLNVLKLSARNSNFALSLNWNALNIAMFQLLRPGPTTVFLAEVPHCSGAGCLNDEVLNHWKRVFG